MKRAVRHDDCNKVNMLLIDACLAERSQNNEVFQGGPARDEWLYPRYRADRRCNPPPRWQRLKDGYPQLRLEPLYYMFHLRGIGMDGTSEKRLQDLLELSGNLGDDV